MDIQAFTDIMGQRGCVGNGTVFCGSFNGYPFSVTYQNGGAAKTNYLLNIQMATNKTAKLFKEIKPALKVAAVNCKLLNTQQPNVLALQVRGKDDARIAEGFDLLLNTITGKAKSSGIGIKDRCPVCGLPACDSFAFVSGVYTTAHDVCVRTKAEAEQARVVENEMGGGNYGTGILGAVLGGILGALAPLLVMLATDSIYSILCTAIPLGAYYGYKLAKGKMNKVIIPIVVVITLVMIPLLHWGYYAIDFAALPQLYLSIGDYFYLLQLAPDVMVPELLQIGLFALLGLFFVSGIVFRTGSTIAKTAGFIAASIRPINPAQPVQMPQADTPKAEGE